MSLINRHVYYMGFVIGGASRMLTIRFTVKKVPDSNMLENPGSVMIF